MDKDLIIDPDIHEYNLHELGSYIHSRIEGIKLEEEIDAYEEFIFLLNYSNRIGLKGDHLSLIRSELFKLLRIQLGSPDILRNKDFLISELKSKKRAIKQDITLYLKSEDEGTPQFYSLKAFFPFREKTLTFSTFATSYYEAASIIRKEYGEFHLRHPEDFRIIKKGQQTISTLSHRLNDSLEDKHYETFLKGFDSTIEKIMSKND